MTLKFIGLGLYDEKGLSIKGLEEAQKSEYIYAEFYTSLMPGLSCKRLENLIQKPIKVLSRDEIENYPEQSILEKATFSDVTLLVPGDPMTATTHIDLSLRAKKKGIKTTIVHGASIISAIPSVTGLQSYKFGRTVTVPLSSEKLYLSVYDHIFDNFHRGLHTLILLDLDVEKARFLMINEALTQILQMENKRKKNLMTYERLIIGAARIGGPDMIVKAGKIAKLMKYDFGGPPHSIILPGNLHFIEKMALKLISI